eukprot:657021_1
MAQDGLHSADEDYLPVILDRSAYKRTLTKVFRARGAPLSDLELEMVWSGDFWLYLVFMLEYVAAEILELSGIVYNDLHALDGVASICRHHSLIGVVYDDELRNLFFSEEYKSPDDDKFPDFSRRESAIAFEMDSTQHFRSSSSYSASQSQMARFSVESAGGVVGEPSYSRDSLSLSASSPTRCSAGADAPLRRSSRQSRLSGNLRGNPEEEEEEKETNQIDGFRWFHAGCFVTTSVSSYRRSIQFEDTHHLFLQRSLTRSARLGHFQVFRQILSAFWKSGLHPVNENLDQILAASMVSAASQGHFSIVEFCVEHGANIYAHDDVNSATILDVARVSMPIRIVLCRALCKLIDPQVSTFLMGMHRRVGADSPVRILRRARDDSRKILHTIFMYLGDPLEFMSVSHSKDEPPDEYDMVDSWFDNACRPHLTGPPVNLGEAAM